MSTAALDTVMGSQLGEEVKDSLFDLPLPVWNFLRKCPQEVESYEIFKNLQDLSVVSTVKNLERLLNRYVYAGVIEKKMRYGGPKGLIVRYKINQSYLSDPAAPILCKRANIKEFFVFFRFRDC